MCYNRRVKECKEPLWITAAAFVMPEGGVGDAEEGTETMQASRLSQSDRRFVLCRASAPAPRPTVCRQAWLRQQVAEAQQGVPPPASFVCALQSTGAVHGSDRGRPYHSSPW